MSTRPRISVAIIARDEAHNLRKTLPTLGFADEVVLVDSGSQDDTVAVAEESGARVVRLAWRGFGAQKNAALEETTGEWVLSLDADESVPPALARELVEAVASGRAEAYFLPRLNFFLGQPMRHGGLFPDPKLRLVQRGAARWQERAVHETMSVTDAAVRTATLQQALDHDAYPTLTLYLEHLARYSTLAAAALVEQGRAPKTMPSLVAAVVLNPLLTFLYNYVCRLGFLDGRRGLLYHFFHSFYVAQKYAKAWELSSTKGSKV
jgi:glycosyltransferase involved in cell wall biosynthesis